MGRFGAGSVVATLLLVPGNAPAIGWQPIGPTGGSVDAFAQATSDPQRLYALPVGNGVYRSDDRGASWTRVGFGLPPDRGYQAAGVSPGDANLVLIAADGSDEVSRSTDGGATWTARTVGSGWARAEAIVFDPLVPGRVLLAATGGADPGLFRSTDDGVTWAHSDAGIPSPAPADVAFHPTQAGYVLVASGSSIYRSLDGGAGWSPAGGGPFGVSVEGMSFCRADPSRVWAGGILRSDDGGATFGFTVWSPCSSTVWCGTPVAVADPADPDAALVVSELFDFDGTFLGNEISRTTDSGLSWTAGAYPFGVERLAFDVETAGRAYASTRGGFLVSTNAGLAWTGSMAGITGRSIVTLGSDANGAVYAVGSGLSYAASPGAAWQSRSAGLATSRGTFDANRRSPGVLNTVGSRSSGADAVEPLFARTTDGGLGWALSTLPGSWLEIPMPDVVVTNNGDGSVIYAWGVAAPYAQYRSTDGGASFAKTVSAVWPADAVIDPLDPLRVFAADRISREVLLTTDGGTAWSSRSAGLPAGTFKRIFQDPGAPGRLAVVFQTSGTFRSDDAGLTWTAVPTSLGARIVVDADWDPAADRIAFATASDGVYLSDAGWLNVKLPTRKLKAILFASPADAILLGTDHSSVLLHPIPGPYANAVVAPDPPATPPIALGVFPNPGRRPAGVEFAVSGPPGWSAVLEIFSVDGRRVGTVWSGALPEGEARLAWDARISSGAPAPAGVYFARVRAGTKRVTRRFVLLGG